MICQKEPPREWRTRPKNMKSPCPPSWMKRKMLFRMIQKRNGQCSPGRYSMNTEADW